MQNKQTMKTYANFGVSRSFWQIVHAIQSRKEAGRNMTLLFELVKRDEQRIERKLGKPLKGLKMLEIGVGQGMERARYFGIENTVIGMDLDVIPTGFDLAGYFRLIRRNGPGRFFKTVGRKLIVAGPNRSGWYRAVGRKAMKNPEILNGDICETIPAREEFDVAMSWSVFEHLPDPERALDHMIQALRPGGVLFTSIHLYTSNNGHHDIRAFTGGESELPAWGHLRPQMRDRIHPSSYLNRWRLDRWRALFSEKAPGCEEYLETHSNRYAALMNPQVRAELAEYSEEELLTVDAIYVWRKPGDAPENFGSRG